MKASWSETNIRHAVSFSQSLAGVLKHLGGPFKGKDYQKLRTLIDFLKVDTSHFALQPRTRKSPKEMFVKNSSSSRSTVKHHIRRYGLLPFVCFRCGIDEWQNEKLSLHLEHINGVNNDHRLENLCFLCPNCHSLTPTYAGKKNLKYVCDTCGRKTSNYLGYCSSCAPRAPRICPPGSCLDCHRPTSTKKSLRCHSCANKLMGALRTGKHSKIDWPSTAALAQEAKKTSFSALGRKLGVSDNAIRKRIRKYPDYAATGLQQIRDGEI